MNRGRHISFEGMPGSGKTTQSRILVERLVQTGFNVKYVKSPNGTILGTGIMDILKKTVVSDLAEIFAFLAAFSELIDKEVEPALKQGIWVISDCGIDSAIAHSLYRKENVIDSELFFKLVGRIGKGNSLMPDTTFMLTLPCELGFDRKRLTGDFNVFDECNEAAIREVLAYDDLASKFPSWIKIDSSGPVSDVSSEIWQIVKNWR